MANTLKYEEILDHLTNKLIMVSIMYPTKARFRPYDFFEYEDHEEIINDLVLCGKQSLEFLIENKVMDSKGLFLNDTLDFKEDFEKVTAYEVWQQSWYRLCYNKMLRIVSQWKNKA